ncbi:hypothetical protein PRIPAC_97052 [Pristionchus pacificus]|nr:hypothetical protein PRIPAC_97052 [Pristionchus pacificus]
MYPQIAAYVHMDINSEIYRKILLLIWYGTDFTNLSLSAFLCWKDNKKLGHFPHLIAFYSLLIVLVSQLKSHAIRNGLYDLYDTVDKADNYADTETLAISFVILLIERKKHHRTMNEVELINII